MSHHEHESHDHTRVYLAVFAALMVLTVATFAVSRLDIPNRTIAIAIGLAIATVKGSLVAAYFMHLASERTIIRSVLGMSLVGLLFLVMLPWLDMIKTAGESTQTAAADTHGGGAHAAHGP